MWNRRSAPLCAAEREAAQMWPTSSWCSSYYQMVRLRVVYTREHEIKHDGESCWKTHYNLLELILNIFRKIYFTISINNRLWFRMFFFFVNSRNRCVKTAIVIYDNNNKKNVSKNI